jgi:hypothetical protein
MFPRQLAVFRPHVGVTSASVLPPPRKESIAPGPPRLRVRPPIRSPQSPLVQLGTLPACVFVYRRGLAQKTTRLGPFEAIVVLGFWFSA